MTLRQQITFLRNENPHLRATDIARQLGCSREYVRQVLVKLELPTDPTGFRIRMLRFCRNCGCGISYMLWSGSGLCPTCHWYKHHVIVICTECKKPIIRRISMMRAGALLTRRMSKIYCARPQTNFFCNRVCYWRWVGKNHGRKKNRLHNVPQSCSEKVTK